MTHPRFSDTLAPRRAYIIAVDRPMFSGSIFNALTRIVQRLHGDRYPTIVHVGIAYHGDVVEAMPEGVILHTLKSSIERYSRDSTGPLRVWAAPILSEAPHVVWGRAVAFCGRRYDWAGAVKAGLDWLDWSGLTKATDNDRWFCSEVAARCLRMDNPGELTPSDIVANHRVDWLRRILLHERNK